MSPGLLLPPAFPPLWPPRSPPAAEISSSMNNEWKMQPELRAAARCWAPLAQHPAQQLGMPMGGHLVTPHNVPGAPPALQAAQAGQGWLHPASSQTVF